MTPMGQCHDNSHFSPFQHIGPPPAVVPVWLKNGSTVDFKPATHYILLIIVKAHVKIHMETERLRGSFCPPSQLLMLLRIIRHLGLTQTRGKTLGSSPSPVLGGYIQRTMDPMDYSSL